MVPSESPKAIIFYNGGSCGDLLKSLCLGQLIDRYDITINEVGKVIVDQRFKFALEGSDGPYHGSFDPIECSHRCSEGIVAAFRESRLYWIRMPSRFNHASTVAVFKKIGIADHEDWMMKSPNWFLKAQDTLGRKITNDGDMIAARMAELESYDRKMGEFAIMNGIDELSFSDIIRPTACVAVVERVIGSKLRYMEKLYRQHWQWRQRNKWYLDMIDG